MRILQPASIWFRAARRCGVAAFLLLSASSADTQPWRHDVPRRPDHLSDPEQFNRSRTNPLKSQDIEAHRERIGSVRDLVFAEAGRPAGARLDVAATDAAGTTALTGEARIRDFSESAKAQILNALGSGSANAVAPDTRVSFRGAITSANTFKVRSASIEPANSGVSDIPSDARIARSRITAPIVSPVSVQPVRPAPPRVPSRSNRANVDREPTAIADRATGESETVAPVPAVRPVNDTPAPRFTPEIRSTLRTFAVSIGGRPNAVDVGDGAGDTPDGALAVIPLQGGGRAVVTAINETGAGSHEISFTVENRAAIPAPIQTQTVRLAPTLSAGAPVKIEARITPGHSVEVIAAEPAALLSMSAGAPAGAPAAPVQPAKPISPAPVPPRAVAAAPSAEATNRGAADVAAVTNVETTGEAPIASNRAETFRTAGRLAERLSASGVQPSRIQVTVAVANRRPPDGGAPAGTEAAAAPEAARVDSDAPTFVASGRFSDFDPPVQQALRDIIGRFAEAAALESATAIEVEFDGDDGALQLIAVAVHFEGMANEPDRILIWDGRPSLRSEPGAGDDAPERRLIPSRPDVPSPIPIVRPAGDRSAPALGLLPAAAAAIEYAFGKVPVKMETTFSDAFTRNEISFQLPDENPRTLSLSWRATAERPNRFFIEGTTPSFTDDIRDAVIEKLREALTHGERWAKDALIGDGMVSVEIDVRENAETGEKEFAVVGVGPGVTNAALALARELGLNTADYDLLTDAANALITLQTGRALRIQTAGGEVVLRADAGAVHVIVNRAAAVARAARDLVLSRTALEENADSVAILIGADDRGAVEAVLKAASEATLYHVHMDGKGGGRLAPVRLPDEGARGREDALRNKIEKAG